MDCREDWSLRAEQGVLVVREGKIVARYIDYSLKVVVVVIILAIVVTIMREGKIVAR